jgi:AraC-like DNA-binding protein
MRPGFDFTHTSQRTYEEWGDALRAYPWGTLNVPEPKTFTMSRSALSTYGFELGAIKHECDPDHAYRVRRDHEDVRSDKVDHYHILFQASGSATVMQNDQVTVLAPGDIVVVDAGRPSLLVNNGGIQFDLVLPRTYLISHASLELPGGRRSLRGTAAERALRQLLFDADEAGRLSDWANKQIQRVICDLVCVLFEPTTNPQPLPDAAFQRVCDIIRDGHTDPTLTPSVVAAEAGMSLRKLQSLFTSHGSTCTAYIHSVRLEHAVFLLRRREALRTQEFLSQISFRCGYRDHNYFVRLFRRKFGQSPSSYAKSHCDGS